MDKTTERIKDDAKTERIKWDGKIKDGVTEESRHHFLSGIQDGYIAGAMAENNRAQPLVDMLMNVRAFIAGATAGAMHPFTSLKTLDKEIEAVLQQWKGTGKEVEQ